MELIIICYSIMEHLNHDNNVIIDNLHLGHSCTTQLISLVEDVSRAMDRQHL